MSNNKKKRSHRKFATLRSGLKLRNSPQEDPVVLRRQSESIRPKRSPVVPQLSPVSANHTQSPNRSASAQSSPKREFSKEEVGSRKFLIKQRIHRQVEVEAYTYGFDVAYSDYLIRYNKVWAAIELLDTLQAHQLLRGVVRHADRIATCVTAFSQMMELMKGPSPSCYKLMKRRLNSMLHMVKSVIIQTKTIQEVLIDIGETAEEDYRQPFQIQIDKMDTVRDNLEEVCQRMTTKSIATRASAAMSIDEQLPRPPKSPVRRKYNNPAKLTLPKTIPRDKDVHEEHDDDLGLDSSGSYSTSYDSTE